MNSNLFHNIANVLMVLLSTLTAFMLATGCKAVAVTGALECSNSILASWIGPEVLVAVVAILGALKLVVNALRDGIGGMAKPQPPVVK